MEAEIRVDGFLRAHPSTDPAFLAVAARMRDGVARLRSLASEEHSVRLDTRAARRHRRELRRIIAAELIEYVARVGRRIADAHPELADRFRAPSANTSHATFLAAAWETLNLARAHRALVTDGGSSDELDDLATALTRLEEATERAAASHRSHLGARTELGRLSAELDTVIGLLDGLIRARFAAEPELLAAWDRARHGGDPAELATAGAAAGPDFIQAA
jgi:hypothetical protein